jgi:tetratricopeptide (TPR) repeat protein
VLLLVAGCASLYERGDDMYRQGDLRGALLTWRQISPGDRDHERAAEHIKTAEEEFERLLRRYEKRAQFYEKQDRLAEAILYYRLALKLDPGREPFLDRVQELARVQQHRVADERRGLERALAAGALREARLHAERLEQLDPFDPAVQIELRQMRASIGAEVLRYIEEGKQAYALGDRAGARAAFQGALDLETQNETALGYLAYIRRFEELEQERRLPPSPRAISQQDILAEGHYRAAQQGDAAGDPFRAIAEYEAVLRIQADHGGARRELPALRARLRSRVEDLYEAGKRYFQDEDLPNALRIWRQVLLIDPRHEKTLENVERAERILSRLEEIQTGGS